ncbi:diguanylate cyclase [Vibrio sp. ZSDZ34]|uniref:Diguanylate cyclase n=1 Tax=Vibrio gelatinilyticus TaxID=2893468 RepID=A0A9X2AY39_9VIBR|nr:diguanylate cyclase [Vibrio gelatinilyticus]MCJ2376257.1 diguanylate cyclase [Vibrio gelatinilyticus]
MNINKTLSFSFYIRITMVISIISLLLFNGFNSYKIASLNSKVNERQNEASWFVYQLIKEYANLTTQLRLEPIEIKKLNLSYDLTWSRYDILLNSKVSKSYFKEKKYNLFFQREFDKFKYLEKSLKLIERGAIKKDLVIKEFMLNYSRLIEFTNSNLRIASPILTQNQVNISHLIVIQNITIISTTILSLALLFLITNDLLTKSRWKIKDTMTNCYNRMSLFDFLTHDEKNNNSEFCIVALKITNLKDINRRFGFNHGDEILIRVANKINSIIEQEQRTKKPMTFRLTEKTFIILKENEDIKHDNSFIRSFDEKAFLSDTELIPEVSLITLSNIPKNKIIESLSLLDIR